MDKQKVNKLLDETEVILNNLRKINNQIPVVEDITPDTCDMDFPCSVVFSKSSTVSLSIEDEIQYLVPTEYKKTVFDYEGNLEIEKWLSYLLEDFKVVMFFPITTSTHINTKAKPYYCFREGNKVTCYSYFVGIK